MLRTKDKELKRQRKLRRKPKEDGSKIPKNIRTRKSLRFQVSGSQQLKFCKNTPLTKELKQILGRNVFKIIPEEMKRPGYIPAISVYLDKENRCMVLRADLVEHEDLIVTDENGEAKFEPDTEYKK